MDRFYVNSAQNIGRDTLDDIDGLNVNADGSMEYMDLVNYLGPDAVRLNQLDELVIGRIAIRKHCENMCGIGKRQANRMVADQKFILKISSIEFTSTTSLDVYIEKHKQRAALGRRQAGLETDNLIHITAVNSCYI